MIAIGLAAGVLSWVMAMIVGGTFEPYDSGAGLIINQLLLSAPMLIVAARQRALAALLYLLGAYVAMNAYAYGFGGTGHRVWAALGAITNLMLLIVPAALGLIVIAIRCGRRWLQSFDGE
jgi:hypothetical protein